MTVGKLNCDICLSFSKNKISSKIKMIKLLLILFTIKNIAAICGTVFKEKDL